MQCNGVLNITDCLDVEVECGAGESCFLERIITSSNQIVFNSGCRSNRVCMITEQMTGGLGKRDLVRKNRDIVTCSECCNATKDDNGPCNTRLCGQNPPVNRPAKCLDCTMKASVGACLTRTICQETQVCGNEITVVGGTMVRYNYYCEERHLCHTAYQSLEKLRGTSSRKARSSHSDGIAVCNSCCIGNECNKSDCFFLQHNFTSADFAPLTTPSTAG